MTQIVIATLLVFTVVAMVFVGVWSAAQLAMCPVAGAELWRYRRRSTQRARALISHLAVPPQVSIIVPSYNEGPTIAGSVRALLAQEYDAREIVVVNDGSSDDTLAILIDTFGMVPAPLAFAQPLESAAVRGIYRSISEPDLVVVDKQNGGSKSDAVNAGINAASGTLVLVVDADTVLEPDALSRAVLPFVEDPTVVAAGGNIAIINGGRIENGRIVDIELPRSWLARFQIVEYMRAFLLFRLTCAAANAVVLISGAFGLFRRDAVIAVGGYDQTAIGEDMDLTIRLQRHFRSRGEAMRIAFDPQPLGWTQAPEDLVSLKNQRCRWRRGLMQVLWRQRAMILNPRYGAIAFGVLPYIVLFEGLQPLLEFTGYGVALGAALFGLIQLHHFLIMNVVTVLLGATVTLAAVLLSDVATRRYMRGRDLGLFVLVVLLESCGYRQMNAWWGCLGTFQAMTGRKGWGAMKRRAFDGAPTASA